MISIKNLSKTFNKDIHAVKNVDLEIDEGEVRIASRFGQGQMWLKSPFNGTPENIRLHSPAPPLPHQSMTRFWAKLVDEAKRI